MSDKCSEKYYAVKGRLVFHRPQCRFISAYDPSRLTEVADYGSGIILGMTPCNCCRPQVSGGAVLDVAAAESFCKKHGMVCSSGGGGIVITTCAALWRIYRSGSKLFLHHEKWTFRAAKYGKRAGFMIRDKEFSDIADALFYAYCHDKRYRNALSNADAISDIRI